MIVFRLAKLKYSKDLSGRGAEKSGGRWNSKGTPMLYTGITRALCTTEIAVHTPLGNVPDDYTLTTLELPDKAPVFQPEVRQLPPDWRSLPHSNSTQLLGDRFISENKFLAMQVPSAVVQGEYNILINPHHADIAKVKILKTEPFVFDERLFIR